MDVFSPAKRRRIMQSIRRENTRPEQILAALFDMGDLSYQRNVVDLPGKPDFFFPGLELVVFVHGCFWHGHDGCRKGRSRPKSNARYWRQKIRRNQCRDRRITRRLRSWGYSVFTVWECELKLGRVPKRLATRIGLTPAKEG